VIVPRPVRAKALAASWEELEVGRQMLAAADRIARECPGPRPG